MKLGSGERVDVTGQGLSSTPQAERVLLSLASCGLRLDEGDVLVLEYRVLAGRVLEVGGRDLVVNPEAARLVVEARRVGSGYIVVFRLVYRGAALAPVDGKPMEEWERVDLNFSRELRLVYEPGTGYSFENGTYVGHVFPLFARGEQVVLDYLWAKPGEPYRLESRRRVTATLQLLEVLNLDEGVALAFNGSGAPVGLPSRVDWSRVEKSLKGYGGLVEKLVNLRGCGRVLASATYSSTGPWQLDVVVDYPTGIPVFMVLEGAARYMPGGAYTRGGVEAKELPASILAYLLGVRSPLLSLELADARLEPGRGSTA